MAGIRTAAVWTIGMATLSTAVGQTSLGNFIFSGLQTENWIYVLTGCIAVLTCGGDRVRKARTNETNARKSISLRRPQGRTQAPMVGCVSSPTSCGVPWRRSFRSWRATWSARAMINSVRSASAPARSPAEAGMFLPLGSLIGSCINIPIAELPERDVQSGAKVSFFGMQYVVPTVVKWPGTVIAVNVDGAARRTPARPLPPTWKTCWRSIRGGGM